MKTYPRYKRYDLGKQAAGTVVEVVLSCINNVRLMDHANFQRYVESKPYKCVGGRIEKSPTRFTIPINGQWHVVVDKIGFQTLANSNVRAIPPASSKSGGAKSPTASNVVTGVFVADRPDSEAHVVTRIMQELNTYKQIANTDMLTGLANRRAFDMKLEELFNEPRTLPQMAVIICDVDHFKSFNDTYGHAVGDTVLKTVAEAVRDSLPDNAMPARIGGEEFAIIVEAASLEQVHQIAETTRKAVENREFIDPETRTNCGQVTISMGICMGNEATKPSELYQKSDLALYASKKGGRNRCSVFDPSMVDEQDTQDPAPAKSRRRQGSRNPNRKEIDLRL